MNITIRYDNGRIDVFDTMSFTAPQPYPTTNMLTNFELKLDEIGRKGLWLAAHYYDVGNAYRQNAPDGEIPVARRKRGWRFLLAQADEVGHIQAVEMDASPVLRRAGGALFDCARFEDVAGRVLGPQPAALYPRILALYSFLERAHDAQGESTDPEDVAAEFGFTAQMVEAVENAWQPASDAEQDQEEIWEEDDEDR